ncbi:MAG: TIGR03960 family B12-binding radical SAM protein [Nitrospinota bacterium]
MNNHPYLKWLDIIHNPSQYIGNEVNSVIKDPSKVDCRIALCFPELYKIGMSHLGLKILYSAVNSMDNLWAERFFHPEPDFEKIVREGGGTLRSHESHDPLSAFDIAGFSITTELCYTGILLMLDLGGVPVKSADRDESHPLVIGGGAGVFNPEPMADFFDLFVLGEAEELLPELCLKLAEYKKEGATKKETLKKLAKLKGVYVPMFFEPVYEGERFKEIKKIDPDIPNPKRIFIKDLNDSPYPTQMVIPYGQPVFDRISVEIDRGCTQGCRFCQAGTTYRPVRERKPEKVVEIIESAVKATGFDDVSMASLSSGDYSHIEALVTELMDRYSQEKVSVSLPSLRSGTLTEELINQVRRVRKTGFTITAEAGAERLRKVINKKITDEEIIETARRILSGGWRRLKLYFMIGLPTETDDDLYAIVELVREIKSLHENGKRFRDINVGVSQFVPKPHTAFQWTAMDSLENLLRKKKILLDAFKKMRGVEMKGHDVEMSFLEGVFSRGDRRLGQTVLEAYNSGCRLDGWTEHFRMDLWMDAFRKTGVTPHNYTVTPLGKEKKLPWDHIDTGVTKEYLLGELEESEKGAVTHDCRTHSCHKCGLHPRGKIVVKNPPVFPPHEQAGTEMPKTFFRYRIHFGKEGLMRYLSHTELMAAFTRSVKRAGLPVAYSQGMHPHPKISYGAALPVGVASVCEMLDIEFEKNLSCGEIKERLNSRLEKGICVNAVVPLKPPYLSIQSQVSISIYEMIDSAVMKDAEPSIKEVKAALEGFDGVKIDGPETRDGADVLRIESPVLGIVSKLKKALPDFALGETRQMVKCGVIMKSQEMPEAVHTN